MNQKKAVKDFFPIFPKLPELYTKKSSISNYGFPKKKILIIKNFLMFTGFCLMRVSGLTIFFYHLFSLRTFANS